MLFVFIPTIDGLDPINVILRKLNIATEDVTGVHQSPNVSRMSKSKGMAKFMSCHPIQVII